MSLSINGLLLSNFKIFFFAVKHVLWFQYVDLFTSENIKNSSVVHIKCVWNFLFFLLFFFQTHLMCTTLECFMVKNHYSAYYWLSWRSYDEKRKKFVTQDVTNFSPIFIQWFKNKSANTEQKCKHSSGKISTYFIEVYC